MAEIKNPKQYDLEDQTLFFAQQIREFAKNLPRTISNIEDVKQIVRSSGSIGANYIEANESLGKKDFIMRIKICRKESKETEYWLHLLNIGKFKAEKEKLIKETIELRKIFGAILEKSK